MNIGGVLGVVSFILYDVSFFGSDRQCAAQARSCKNRLVDIATDPAKLSVISYTTKRISIKSLREASPCFDVPFNVELLLRQWEMRKEVGNLVYRFEGYRPGQHG